MEQLEQMDVLLLVERDSRCDVLCAECGIAAADDVLQVGGGNFRGGDVAGEDLVCKILEGQVLPLGRPILGKGRDFLGDEETAIGGKTLEYDFLERKLVLSV